MSVELLYTSAQHGLKQGSRGFCTVVSTVGTPLNLATRLESLSGYRHVFPPKSADAKLNPVAYSHLRLTIGGRMVSIISRVADYGLDYSQRTNKIAHHVVLDLSEQPAAGPAWLMRQPGIFRHDWDGNCQTPRTGPTIPQDDQPARVCLQWKSLVGDAGWAGILAQSFSTVNAKPVWIIYSVEQAGQLLTLIDEAIALLPVNQRWNATFSTYATSLPPDVDCRLRCVLVGTDEARLAQARGLVIDLTKPMPAAPESSLSAAARVGLGMVAQTPAPTPVAPKQPDVADLASTERGQQLAMEKQREYELVPEMPPALPPPTRSMPQTIELPRKNNWAFVASIIAASAFLLIGVGICVYAMRTHHLEDTQLAAGKTENQETVADQSDKDPSDGVAQPIEMPAEGNATKDDEHPAGDEEERSANLGQPSPPADDSSALGTNEKEADDSAGEEQPVTEDPKKADDRQDATPQSGPTTDADPKDAASPTTSPESSRLFSFDKEFDAHFVSVNYAQEKATLESEISLPVSLLDNIFAKFGENGRHNRLEERKKNFLDLLSGANEKPITRGNWRLTNLSIADDADGKTLRVEIVGNFLNPDFERRREESREQLVQWNNKTLNELVSSKRVTDDYKKQSQRTRKNLMDQLKLAEQHGINLKVWQSDLVDQSKDLQKNGGTQEVHGTIEIEKQRVGELLSILESIETVQKNLQDEYLKLTQDFVNGQPINFSDFFFLGEIKEDETCWEALIIRLKPVMPKVR